MQFGPRSPRWWTLAASAIIHALLFGGAMLAVGQRSVALVRPGTLLQVELIAAPAAVAVAAPTASTATVARAAAPAAPSAPARDDIRYFFPEELERQLILLRDRSGDDSVSVRRAVVMHLFVDIAGRVAAIGFEGEAPDAPEQQRLRAAFMTLEFLPALRAGHPVPARIKIELLPEPG